MEDIPWSSNQLKRLGRFLRTGDVGNGNYPAYDDVWRWYNDLCAEVQSVIDDQDWSPLVGDDVPVFGVSRAKTRQTLSDKLVRQPQWQLPSISDLGGVRYDLSISLSVQDAMADSIHGIFPDSWVKDLRRGEHSGYRAVHVLIKHRGGNVEVQIRTRLQGAWANAYERAGDYFGREIRYGKLPEDESARDIVHMMQLLSTSQITEIEERRNEVALKALEFYSPRSGVVDEPPLFLETRRESISRVDLGKQDDEMKKVEDEIHASLGAAEEAFHRLILVQEKGV